MSGASANPNAGAPVAGPAAPPALVGGTAAPPPALRRVPLDVDIARQDALSACNPDIDRPFDSLEDACNRLLPFHVLADYDADDVNDKFLDSTGRVLSRTQLWNESLTGKIHEFKAAFQKQIDVFNALSKRREEGEMRAEEGLMIEQLLFQDEKRKVIEMKAEMERERAERDAEVRMKEAVERARAEQEASRHHQVARLVPAGLSSFGDSSGFGGGLQLHEEGKSGHDPNSPEQDGAVDDMLNEWDEDANESIDLLTQNGPEAGTLDLNALTSTR